MRFLSANLIFSGKEFLKSDAILVLDDRNSIHDITSADKVETSNIECFEGIITPGFINTHCHLELSHLKDKIQKHTGIVNFALNIIKQRNEIPLELQLEYMLQADALMYKEGIVAVGDISNTLTSIQSKKKSALVYHTFLELIGLNPERAVNALEEGKKIHQEFITNNLSASLAPHAPYSVSQQLIAFIVNECEKLKKPTSIHNQESKAENDFFMEKAGDYLNLYKTLNIPIDFFSATHKSSLQSVINALNVNVNTLLVHNTFTSYQDIEIAQKRHPNLYWCLCPQANLYIENTLPDVSLLLANDCKVTLGTDSLASNCTLSIIEEINCILKHQPSIELDVLLKAATYNGAEFLGIDNRYGLLEKNKKPGINLIEGKKGNYMVKKLF